MDRLPYEIIREIFAYMPRGSDVSSFRLTSRLPAAVGIEFLIPSLSFNLTGTSLQRVEDVSRHPGLSRHVREVTYNLSSLKEYDNVQSLKRFIRDTGHYGLDLYVDPPPRSPEEIACARKMGFFPVDLNWQVDTQKLESFCKKYYQIVKEQQDIKFVRKDTTVIQQAVSHFPNLRSIRFDGSPYYPCGLHRS